MAELKTKPTKDSIAKFLDTLNEQQKSDSKQLINMMKQATKEEPVLWGKNIVGFGTYHYVYATGREGDWFTVGFSPRKQQMSIYIMSGFSKFDKQLKKLGPHKLGKSCLYVKKLEDVDHKILQKIITESVKFVNSGDRGC